MARQVQVKMLQISAGPAGNFDAGVVRTVDESEAKALVAARAAVVVEAAPAVEEPTKPQTAAERKAAAKAEAAAKAAAEKEQTE